MVFGEDDWGNAHGEWKDAEERGVVPVQVEVLEEEEEPEEIES